MTILEALERAKRMQKDRPAARDRSPRSTMVRRGTVEIMRSPLARLSYPRLNPDPQVCGENRVLWSGAGLSPYTAASDAYKIVRTRLLNRIEAERWSSLAVTSPGAGEGKSLTALNMAMTVAMEGKRNVFLLDLDLRRPSLCRYLGVTPANEIGEYLHDGAPLDAIFNLVALDNLVLAAGRTSFEHSAELLGGERLTAMLAHIQRIDEHALTVIDLPPLLSTADALIVSAHVSATLLVVSEGKTSRDGLARSAELLKNVTMAGIVLNCSQESGGNYYYG